MDAPTAPQPTSQDTFSHSWLVSVWATVTALGLVLMGVLTVLSIHPTCWAVGGYVIAIGVATAVMEAPFLAKLHAYAEKLTNVTSGLQFWHKGIIYFVYEFWHKGIIYFVLTIPVFFCIGFASVIAIILILSNGVGYFVLAIGPKGNRAARPTDTATLLDNAETGKTFGP